MHILIWNETYFPVMGGVETMTHRLAKGLMAKGHAVAVVAEQSSPALAMRETLDGIEVHRFPFFSGLSALASLSTDSLSRIAAVERGVRRLKTEFRPDIVQVNLTGANPLFHLRSQAAWPAPTLVMIHTMPSPTMDSVLLRKIAASASLLIAPSDFASAGFARAVGDGRQVLTIYPGIDPAGFDPPNARRRELPRQFVVMGRLVNEKGVDVAIRAMEQVRATARLTIAGGGPAEPSLRELVTQLKLQDVIEFVGVVDAAARRELLANAYAVIVPSRWIEPFGTVAAEAGFAQLPVIVSRSGGMTEVVIEGQTGLLVPPDNPQALSRAMVRLCDDPALATSMGLEGHRRAMQLFTSSILVDRLETLYTQMRPGLAPASTEPYSSS